MKGFVSEAAAKKGASQTFAAWFMIHPDDSRDKIEILLLLN